MKKNTHDAAAPWWKFGHVWMVFGGPALVVVASLVTAYIAVTRADPVIAEDYYLKGIEINKTLGGPTTPAGLAPALQARNHAATGVVPTPKSTSKP